MTKGLSTPTPHRELPILLTFTFGAPDQADQSWELLEELVGEDPDMALETGTGEILLYGRDEVQLDAVLERLAELLGGALPSVRPDVHYLETVTSQIRQDYTHRKQSRGAGEYAEIALIVGPNHPGRGVLARVHERRIAANLIAGVENGIRSALAHGLVAGKPVTDIVVIAVDCPSHDGDSSAEVFETAARMALREGMRAAGPVLMEPVMDVEIVAPRACSGMIAKDLSGRRGQVLGQEPSGDRVVFCAQVSMGTMFGYSNTLRMISGGEGRLAMRYSHHAPVPTNPPDDRFPQEAAVRA